MNHPDYDWYIKHGHTDHAFDLWVHAKAQFTVDVQRRIELVYGPNLPGLKVRELTNQAAYRAQFEQDRYGAMTSVLDAITQSIPGPDPPPAERRGLDVPEAELTGGFLYVKPFWAPGKMFTMSRDQLENQCIPSLKAHGNVALCTALWHRGDEWSDAFDGLAHQQHMIDVLQLLDRNGLAPIMGGMPNNYITEVLGMNFLRFYNIQHEIARVVAPFVRWYFPMWEGAETLGGRFNDQRRAMMVAIREGTTRADVPRLRIGRHERALEGVFVEDIQFLGPVFCGLQTGFGTPNHAIAEFVRDDVARIDRFARDGRFGDADCLVGVMEHSIPNVSPRWQPTQTWAEAQRRGRVAIDAGATFDFNGGQTR